MSTNYLPDVLETTEAERLATGALESGWGVFRDGPAKYARVLVRPGWPGTASCWRTRPPGNTGGDALWTSLHRAEKAHAAD